MTDPSVTPGRRRRFPRAEVLSLIGDLAAQTGAGDDITVVDNGSADGTEEAALARLRGLQGRLYY